MKLNKKIYFTALLILIVSAVYRASPLREFGFAPQLAIAIFSGFIFTDNKKWAFILPLASMLLSDCIYEVLYQLKLSTIYGFYGKGQLVNYALVALVTCIGFFIGKINLTRILGAAIAAPTLFFLLSNFEVWIGNTGYQRSKTLSGLLACYNDGLPFYKNSLAGTLIFSAILFGAYYFATSRAASKKEA